MINEAVENDLGNTPQLITKIKDGNIDDAKKLLKEGIYPLFYKDKYGNTALIAASKHGPPDLVRALLKAGANIEAKNNEGDTALITAAMEGKTDVVLGLLEAGANKEATNNDGETALMMATMNGQIKVVQVLLNAGADLDATDKNSSTALWWALWFNNGHNIEVVRALLKAGALKANDGGYEIIAAVFLGDAGVIRALLEAGANKEVIMKDGLNAMMIASRKGNTQIVCALLDAGADREVTNNDGETALMLASKYGHADVVRALLKAGANIEAKDNNGNTALIYASGKGHPKVVRALLENGANKEAMNNSSETALIVAACDNQKWLYLDCLQPLLEAGANIEAKDNNGNTALMLASGKGYSCVVSKLLDAGADTLAKDNNGNTARSVAKNQYIVNLLDKNNMMMLMHAILEGHFANVLAYCRLVKQAGKIDEYFEGYTPLMMAILKRHYDIVLVLLDAGADPDKASEHDSSPMSSAVKEKHMYVINLLYNHKTANMQSKERSVKRSVQFSQDIEQVRFFDKNEDNEPIVKLLSNAKGARATECSTKHCTEHCTGYCTICMEVPSVHDKVWSCKKCQHKMHFACWQKYVIKGSTTCTVCRKPFT